jgi:hypothetical protein
VSNILGLTMLGNNHSLAEIPVVVHVPEYIKDAKSILKKALASGKSLDKLIVCLASIPELHSNRDALSSEAIKSWNCG